MFSHRPALAWLRPALVLTATRFLAGAAAAWAAIMAESFVLYLVLLLTSEFTEARDSGSPVALLFWLIVVAVAAVPTVAVLLVPAVVIGEITVAGRRPLRRWLLALGVLIGVLTLVGAGIVAGTDVSPNLAMLAVGVALAVLFLPLAGFAGVTYGAERLLRVAAGWLNRKADVSTGFPR